MAVLCEGDPFFYGSFQYLFTRLAERFPVQVVPGVSSLTATAAALGINQEVEGKRRQDCKQHSGLGQAQFHDSPQAGQREYIGSVKTMPAANRQVQIVIADSPNRCDQSAREPAVVRSAD